MYRIFVVLFAMVWTGCSDQQFSGLGSGVSAPGPEISVNPPSLDFGALREGEELVLTLQVTNVGKSELDVEQIEMRGMASFTLLSADLNFRLPPGASKDVDVAFSPFEAPPNDGSVVFFSNDPARWAVEVPLVGEGAIPQLQIDPEPYDYGPEYIGCDETESFELRNVGGEDLVIDDIQYSGPAAFWLERSTLPALPIVLPPGESTPVEVTFAPEETTVVGGTLQVLSNDPRGWVEGVQSGEGEYFEEREDRFTVPEAPPVDILFAVDQSCSMDDDNARLASNFSSFIGTISSVTTGWRIGVVTNNNGCFKGGYLEETTSGYESRFNSAVLANDGGSNTEKLLTLSYDALQKTGSGCNSGFLRPSALLHVIMVSDEPEQSSTAWSTRVSQIQSFKSDPALVKLSAIAGDYPGGCSTAAAGTGYYQAVTATGGEFLSICSTSWLSHIDKLALASLEGLNEYDLSSADPDPSSFVVTVDGVEWTTGWVYDASTNQIIIEDEVEENAEIVVTYGVLATCK